jgi:hypothetical protein
MTHYFFHSPELHQTRLRDAQRERLGTVERGAAPEPMRRVRGARIAVAIARRVPRLRQRAALREV